MNTNTTLPTLAQLAVLFDGAPGRTRAASIATIRAARATGWTSTTGFNDDIFVLASAALLERNEGACNLEAGYLAVLEWAEIYAEHSTMSVERWRAACLDAIAMIVDGPESW